MRGSRVTKLSSSQRAPPGSRAARDFSVLERALLERATDLLDEDCSGRTVGSSKE